MPSSAVSWPSSSTVCDTRTPIIFPRINHETHEAANANAPIASTPMSWTPKLPPAAMQTARVPQIPANKWAGYRTYDVVNFKDLQHFNPTDAQHATHSTDYERPVVIDDIWPGRNRDQSGKRTVEDGEQIDAS